MTQEEAVNRLVPFPRKFVPRCRVPPIYASADTLSPKSPDLDTLKNSQLEELDLIKNYAPNPHRTVDQQNCVNR